MYNEVYQLKRVPGAEPCDTEMVENMKRSYEEALTVAIKEYLPSQVEPCPAMWRTPRFKNSSVGPLGQTMLRSKVKNIRMTLIDQKHYEPPLEDSNNWVLWQRCPSCGPRCPLACVGSHQASSKIK